MQPTIGAQNLVQPLPHDFSRRMGSHWSDKLNMPITPSLTPVWSTMCEHLNRSAVATAGGYSSHSSVVLPLPTGSGKTQGACVYAAMQAALNKREPMRSVGTIIVTRLIEDADAVAAEINDLAATEVAVSDHSTTRASPEALFNADTLVITQAAYRGAAESYGVGDPNKWERLSSWRGGKRLLVIIDEALANVVQDYCVTPQKLEAVIRGVPQELQHQFPKALKILRSIATWLKARESSSDAPFVQQLWDVGLPPESLQEIQKLREAMRGTLCGPLFSDEAPSLVDGVLQDTEGLLADHAYYFKSGDQASINGGRYQIPQALPGAVILDATANHDVLYQLLGDRASIALIPPGVRSYRNVTLHVCRPSGGLGKHKMEQTKQVRLPRLVAHLREILQPGRSVFLCVHKHSKAVAESYSSKELPLAVGNWGAVDGKNDWKDCDTAVIWGLPYMDQRRAINSVYATHGPQGTSWLQGNANKQQPNLINIIMQRHLSTSVIQAINRVRCRKVTDLLGNCLPCDIFIALPRGWQGDAILNDIREAMPGIVVQPWDYEIDGPKVYAPRRNSANEALLTLMKQREPGPTPFPVMSIGVQI